MLDIFNQQPLTLVRSNATGDVMTIYLGLSILMQPNYHDTASKLLFYVIILIKILTRWRDPSVGGLQEREPWQRGLVDGEE